MKRSIFIIAILCGASSFLSAQTVAKQIPTFGKEVTTTIEKNLAIKPEFMNVNGGCNPLAYLSEFNLKELVPDAKKFDDFVGKIDFTYGNKLQGLQQQLTIPPNTTTNDVAIDHLGKSKNFADFVRKLTGSEVYELSENDQNILLDYYVNHPLKKKVSVHVAGKKFIKAKNRPCMASSSSELTLTEWKSYPKLKWELSTTITMICDCEQQPPADLSEGTVTYKAEIRSTRTNNKLQFNKAKLLGPIHIDAQCCGLEDEYVEEDDENEEPMGPTQEYTPPQQTLGGSAGIGFSQDFEEINYCIGLEYLFQLTQFGANPLYAGAHASYGGFSFNGNESSLFQLGASVQLFTPFSDYLNRVHITNGISASYLIGSQTTNGLTDNLNGYSIMLHTGLNLPINENVSISLMVPVVSFQHVSFSNDENAVDISVNETTVLINKNNPLQIGLRFRL